MRKETRIKTGQRKRGPELSAVGILLMIRPEACNGLFRNIRAFKAPDVEVEDGKFIFGQDVILWACLYPSPQFGELFVKVLGDVRIEVALGIPSNVESTLDVESAGSIALNRVVSAHDG